MGQPYVLPKRSKDSICWLERRVVRTRLSFPWITEHRWTLLRWPCLALQTLYGRTIAFTSYPCENRHSAVVKHSAQLEKRLTGGPLKAGDTSQSSAWWHRGSPGRLVMKVMLLMGKKNLASIVQREERLPKHGIPTSTLPPGLLPCLSPWFLSSCNHSSASYDRLSHHLFTVAIPLFSIIELMWVIRVLR